MIDPHDDTPGARSALARNHANTAEAILAGVHEHTSKRGRKLGEQQAHELALANTHASLAVYYATCAR